MQNFSPAPTQLVRSLISHRELITAMSKREVIGRYRGSVLGIVWSLFNPILMLTVYTFVFSVVFRARWSVGSESKTEFAVVLFVGMIIYALFAECINRAPGLITGNVNYVKKVVFPLEIMPVVTLCASLFHLAVSLVVWLVFYLIINGSLHWTVIYLPLVLLPLILMTVGLAWFLASLGVYLRDVAQTVGIFTTILMFMSPVFFPVTALPAEYRPFIYANPLTFVIESARDVLIWGKAPDWAMLAMATAASGIIACLGYAWFQKTRRGFADVL